jgi:hypothetical protein
MGRDSINGQMEDNIADIIETIKNMDKELTHGLTAESTSASGKTIKDTVKESIISAKSK